MANGSRIFLPILHGGALQDVAQDLMLNSHSHDLGIMDWADGLSLVGSLHDVKEGLAMVGLHATEDLCSGKIPKHSLLYRVQVSVHIQREQDAWEHLSNVYLHDMMKDRGSIPALPDMPDSSPWAAGYLLPATRHLGEDTIRIIQSYGRVAAAAAINHSLWTMRQLSSRRGPSASSDSG